MIAKDLIVKKRRGTKFVESQKLRVRSSLMFPAAYAILGRAIFSQLLQSREKNTEYANS